MLNWFSPECILCDPYLYGKHLFDCRSYRTSRQHTQDFDEEYMPKNAPGPFTFHDDFRVALLTIVDMAAKPTYKKDKVPKEPGFRASSAKASANKIGLEQKFIRAMMGFLECDRSQEAHLDIWM